MQRRALLVGLDVYPDPRNNLNSCVADTLAFKNLLVDSYGFASRDIQLLHNQAATLATVLAALDDLFSGAQMGDELVYFESSHGYRYPEGNTMVEALCLYDGFLNDSELSQRTRSIPADVLTVVLDSCHSGGMNKVFFPPGSVQLARAKVWQPPSDQAARDAQLFTQVTQFKFFGRSVTSTSGAVAKNFVLDPVGVVAPKDFSDGGGDLNGALFAACQADQTAAAGSPATNNLSAFTYGLTRELDLSISLRDLCARVASRLAALNMSQTPIAIAPPAHQELLTESFISMQQVDGQPRGGDGPPVPTGNGFDPEEWLRRQLGSLV